MKLSQVGIQLFTLRNHLRTPADIAKTLKRVKEIGYATVQASGMGPIPEEELLEILASEGLTLCATHEGAQKIIDQPEAVIERLHKLKCNLTAYPHPAGVDLSNETEVTTWIQQLNAAGEKLRAAGITLAYHNHGSEFARHGKKTVLDRIYDETRPDCLQAELDTYWVQYGGGDPVAWCAKMQNRLPILHLKDYKFNLAAEKPGPTFCEIGNGTLNFKAIIAAAEASGCHHFVVEQDTTPGCPFESIQQSFEYIREHLVSA